MKSANISGKPIIINVVEEYVKNNNHLFQLDDHACWICAKAVESDNIGLWIEKPDWNYDVKNTKSFLEIYIFIKWEFVKSIALMPDDFLKEYGLKLSDDIKTMGFKHAH
jgi:hypothetical protein